MIEETIQSILVQSPTLAVVLVMLVRSENRVDRLLEALIALLPDKTDVVVPDADVDVVNAKNIDKL